MKGRYKIHRSEVEDNVANNVRVALKKLPMQLYDESGERASYRFEVAPLSEQRGKSQDWNVLPDKPVGEYETLVDKVSASFQFLGASQRAVTVKIRGEILEHELHLFYKKD